MKGREFKGAITRVNEAVANIKRTLSGDADTAWDLRDMSDSEFYKLVVLVQCERARRGRL